MTDKKLFTEAIAKMTELAEKKQRVRVERNIEYDLTSPEWTIEGVLYCDDPDNPADPKTCWIVSLGWDNVMPWDGASVTFTTDNVVRLIDKRTSMYVIVS